MQSSNLKISIEMWERLKTKKDNFQITSLQLKPIKNGKLPKSHRYDQLPLLRSHPGGFSGAGCLGLAVAKIGIFYKLENIIKEK
ncbi:hypothetical protein CHRY9293_02711 [Chryseobacterium potabilaquae]|uniref:Uncharacterized protein n=1 Tax=Chryseobacterium potabilaquae TaxID=2675057 RepID=A0A6N4XB48_9FLAO|nr:hypothetical protein CHRY9293_02711 [Chryseobacterium potabilaquae]